MEKYSNRLVKRVGDFGIFKSFIGLFNVINLETGQIAATTNFCSVEDAEEYISKGVTYK